jgi:hypothetical protein
MATAATPDVVVQLDWVMKNGIVTVTPRDQDRFTIKVDRAIEILQQAARADKFKLQFNLLLRELGKWLNDRNDVSHAYLTQRDGALAFVVVRSSCEYDDDFEDNLSDFDYQIANDPDLDLIKMDAIALPNASIGAVFSFIDQDFVLEYVHHGNRGRPHSASK